MDKVFFLTGAFPPQTGGEFYNYQLSSYFEGLGIEQEIVSLHQQRHYLRLGKIPLVGNILVSLILAIFLYRCKGILVEDHYFSQYLWITNIIQRFYRKKQIITLVHLFYGYDSTDSNDIRRKLNQIKERLRLRFSSLIVTSSDYSKREIVSLGISSSMIHVLSPGLDREKFKLVSQSPIEKTSKKVLCVGNYIPRKGLIFLVEAFSKIDRKEFTLHFVGNSKKRSTYLNQLVSTVNHLKLGNVIFFHDGSNQNHLKELYASSDVFVLPSLQETFGIVFLEAMHYSLPIITTNVTAMPELVTHDKNGILVPPEDSDALAKALTRLIENSELRAEMGKAGKQQVENGYFWEQTSAKFLSLIQSVSVDD